MSNLELIYFLHQFLHQLYWVKPLLRLQHWEAKMTSVLRIPVQNRLKTRGRNSRERKFMTQRKWFFLPQEESAYPEETTGFAEPELCLVQREKTRFAVFRVEPLCEALPVSDRIWPRPQRGDLQGGALSKLLQVRFSKPEINPVNAKGNQSWMFIGRTDAEAETPIL